MSRRCPGPRLWHGDCIEIDRHESKIPAGGVRENPTNDHRVGRKRIPRSLPEKRMNKERRSHIMRKTFIAFLALAVLAGAAAAQTPTGKIIARPRTSRTRRCPAFRSRPKAPAWSARPRRSPTRPDYTGCSPCLRGPTTCPSACRASRRSSGRTSSSSWNRPSPWTSS